MFSRFDKRLAPSECVAVLVAMTRRKQSDRMPRLRALGALVVLVWVAAFAFCSAEPLFDHHHHDSDAAAAHTDGHHDADSSHGSESNRSGGHDNSFCVSLKSIDHSVAAVHLPRPELSANIDLAFLWFDQQLAHERPIAAAVRQAKPCDWVFTHGVCTAPANRAHAPPSLA